MAKPLVIVESPAKARTIAGFLGNEYVVESSVGHIWDIETKGLSIDIEGGFVPNYVVSPSKRDVIKRLRAALKDADELYLATDEDREGEAISAHLLQELKPRVPVKRMVFHEITRSAIQEAIDNPRAIDEGLVDAQETRRVLDRLYGYEVSPVLWRKINQGLSAGRVQSPAVRLIVERERERIAFRSADYWDFEAAFPTDPAFTATLLAVDHQRVATGKDFDDRGNPTRIEVVVLDEPAVRELVSVTEGQTFTVRSTEDKPYTSRPKPPFITSTLQQEGGRKLRMSAAQVMRVAQDLYQNGYITYMRTDSTNLSDTALTAARNQVRELYGADYVPDAPRTYAKKVKNAQEAHEAIRPAGETFRTPDSLAGELRGDQLRLYDLIWKRTVASQMADAKGRSVSVRLAATTTDGRDVELAASGRTITFPGYLRAYVEGADDPDAELDDRETLLPNMAEGDTLPIPELEAKGHSTSPPARYTEASLIKRLEELGIGRPSTYATVPGTLLDRGYVTKRGTALVPTWTAFAVVKLLEEHFTNLVDYAFTARMEDDLDEIARGEAERVPWLHQFWFGSGGNGSSDGPLDSDGGLPDVSPGSQGLKDLIEAGMSEINPAELNVVQTLSSEDGDPIEVRPGRYGPYVKQGERTASIPDDLAPDELESARAIALLDAPSGDKHLGTDPDTGLEVIARNGRFGPYVQLGEMPEGKKVKAADKPKTASLFKDMDLDSLSLDDALRLLTLPRVVGADPADGVEITAQNGRYGPYIRKGSDSRSLESESQLLTLTLDEALAILAQPKQRGRRAAAPPLKELGPDPVSGQPIVLKDGRFGYYVTDGETNASLRKGDEVELITPERAAELLQIRRETAPAKKKRGAKKAPAKKKATKKSAAKKSAAKKSAAKKSAAKKAPAKKSAARTEAATNGSASD